jgi:carbamoyl-phosphate synthase small subunit
MKGYLQLATGDIFEGELFGHIEPRSGEVVFNTGMTGYQEVLSDPSYAGQIVVFTYPLIGNYGIHASDFEHVVPRLSGLVVSENCVMPNHAGMIGTLEEALIRYKVPGISGVDTRALTRIIRRHGSVRGVISSELTRITEADQHIYDTTNWVEMVSTKKVLRFPSHQEKKAHVVLFDFGSKKSIAESLRKMGCDVTVVPYNTTPDKLAELKPDGVVFSNGPGNPLILKPLLPNLRQVIERYPTLGICLGHQLIAMALGAATEKLSFGHRGGNHPVRDLRTGKVFMTAQNHSYMVKDESWDERLVSVTHRHVNDGSVEGLRYNGKPVFSVQFHPEAHPGPQDSTSILAEFLEEVKGSVTSYA